MTNASSIFQGQSLNSNLLKGPDLLSNLVGIILRFRESHIAISADIEQMFMQVKVAPSDRSYLRFLWDHNGKIEEYEYTSHIFGATSSPCIASYALRRSAIDKQKHFPEVSHIVERNNYTDDLYISTDDDEKAVNIMSSTKACLSLGCFNLTNWNSNSAAFLQQVSRDQLLNTNEASPQIQKVLGLPWNAKTDTHLIEKKLFKKFPLDNTMVTQRKLLRFVASIFDPLGFIAPLTIRVRKSLQAAWNHGPKWDKPLDLNEFADLTQLQNELREFREISIPRCLFVNKAIKETALHTFSDASEYALSAVSYLRIEYVDETVQVKFIMGKARVAPIKRMTIPNLELQAAVHAALLAQFVTEEHDIHINEKVFWSDSTTVLYWLITPEIRHRIFVANRLAKILDVSTAHDWNYITSADNPADDGSRGYEVKQMNCSSRWLNGPSFLQLPKSDWPSQDILKARNSNVLIVHALQTDLHSAIHCPINIARFSNWNRLVRVAAYCFFFLDRLKKQSSSLSLAHHTLAYKYLIGVAQSQNFGSEIVSLQKGKEILSSSPLKTLCPFVNGKNELRAKGRLSKAMVLETARHPLILDGVNTIVKLLIKNTHVVNSHSGVEQTRSFLMEYYWILKCRAVVRQTIRQCIPCRRMTREISPPQMSDLPSERLPLQNHIAFATTGLDFIGPFPIKQCGKFSTRYILLFSCLVVRAVHLEVSESLSTDSTMSCIRRFISRRGKPKIFYSDNGKSFVGSCSELRKGIEALRSSREFASKLHILDVDINWKFNPPLAPHFDGSWERLFQVFKLSLYKVLGSRTLIDETLSTFTCEIESNMNSRPLTNVSSDINDPLPLTPNHFLLGRPSTNLPSGVFSQSKVAVTKSWKTSQILAQHFWNRFIREYLPNQQKRSKWHKVNQNLKVHDLVWILEDFTPRGLWPLAKVIEVYPGSDKVVRSVKIKTAYGEKIRPVLKLSKISEE